MVTWRMLVAIKRQADVAQEQAGTARKSVDALLNSQRAWIFVTIGKLPDLEQAPSPDRLEMLWVLPIIKNYGQTPARIRRIWAALNQFSPIPAEPSYENANVSNITDIVVPPGASIQRVSLAISMQDFAAARQENVSLCIYGYIDYVDVADRPFQTRFCYVYQVQRGYNPLPSGFYMGGPLAYNQAS